MRGHKWEMTLKGEQTVAVEAQGSLPLEYPRNIQHKDALTLFCPPENRKHTSCRKNTIPVPSKKTISSSEIETLKSKKL